MKKILNVESPREHYVAKATILWCFDARFANALEKYKAMTPQYIFDVIKVAGGVKSIATPESEIDSDREFVVEQITASIKLHKSEAIVIMAHDECGAYGGKRDALDFYLEELEKGEKFLGERFPEKKVVKLFVAFDGIYQIEE